jgi:tRNA pseudouridine55 synthase
MNGILIIDKPAGITSHDVVSRLRRILKTKSIGHTGTLDPFATGVLVMLVGKATRLARFLDKDVKEYEATVRFGFETDTGDVTGNRKVQSSKFQVQSIEEFSIEDVENVLPEFRGEILQTPPMYSAKKVKGRKLYELARQGIEIERKAVEVNIYKLEILSKEFERSTEDFELETLNFELRVACSAGTYIRTLAEDIGKKISVGAHLAALRRTRAGNFDLAKAVSLEKLEEIAENEKLGEIFISMNDALTHLPQIILTKTEVEKTRNGIKFNYENPKMADDQAIRMTDGNDNLAAIGFYNSAEKYVQPKVVLV